MPDAVKVGFVPFSTAPRGILVVFCDDTLKFGPATSKALGAAADMVKRAAAANQFKGKNGSTLDILAPEGSKPALDRGRNRQAVRAQGERLPQIRRRGGRQAQCRQRGRDHHRRTAGRGHEARTGGRDRLGRAAARLQIRSLQDQEKGRRGRRLARRRFARGRRCRLPRTKPSRRTIISSMASSSRANSSMSRRTCCFRTNSRAAPASCASSASMSRCSTSRP